MTSFVAHYNCGRVKNTEKDIEEIQTVRQTNGKKDRTKERKKEWKKEIIKMSFSWVFCSLSKMLKVLRVTSISVTSRKCSVSYCPEITANLFDSTFLNILRKNLFFWHLFVFDDFCYLVSFLL
jgi:hypothetical protein